MESLVRNLWSRDGLGAELALWPLSVLAHVYKGAVTLRATAYRKGYLERERVDVPVISIGNLTVGGTGKTPMAVHLAGVALAQKKRVGLLSRGYGGTNEGRGPLLVSDGATILTDAASAGDEAVMMAEAVPRVPVAVCSNRARGARLLIERCGVELIILDDGFQHLQLERDADLVLLDADQPFGNGRMLPRGPLRERPGVLSRADVVVVRTPDGELPEKLRRRLAHLTAAKLLTARNRIDRVTDGTGQTVKQRSGETVLAVCGIARPERFRATLAELAVEPARLITRPDHARYRAADVAKLVQTANALGATAVMTTAKDAVKLAPLWPESPPLRVVRLAMEVADPTAPDGERDWMARLITLAEKRFAARSGTPSVGEGGEKDGAPVP